MLNQKTISFQNKPMNYYAGGNGPAIVFLHGFCEDHTVWNDFVEPFSSAYKIIAPDFPGFGTSPVVDGLSMAVMADLVKSILDSEGIHDCIMVGHSMGGYVALNFAGRFSSMLNGLVLFHSTAYEDDDQKKQDRQRVADLVLKNDYKKFINDLYGNLFSESFKEKNKEAFKQWKNYAADHCSAESIAAASLAMGDRANTVDVLKNFDHPVLFILGRKDKTIILEKTLPLTHLPKKSAIQILEDAAHMGMIEQPAPAQQALREFLDLCKIVPG
jgi:pimeloyl-ACP methyl ester carboxylesterase